MTETKKRSLKDWAKSKTQSQGISFMEGRKKEELKRLLNTNVTIIDFDFINGEQGEYAVFIVKEDTQSFYFGSSVVTEFLKSAVEDGFADEIRTEGLPVMLTEVKNRKGNRTYIKLEAYPEELPF